MILSWSLSTNGFCIHSIILSLLNVLENICFTKDNLYPTLQYWLIVYLPFFLINLSLVISRVMDI